MRKVAIALVLCLVAGCSGSSSHSTTQSQLQKALAAESIVHGRQGKFTSNRQLLKIVDPSVFWGDALTITTGPNGDDAVCLEKAAPNGATFAIAQAVNGASASTYYEQLSANPADQKKLCNEGADARYYSQWNKSWSS